MNILQIKFNPYCNKGMCEVSGQCALDFVLYSDLPPLLTRELNFCIFCKSS